MTTKSVNIPFIQGLYFQISFIIYLVNIYYLLSDGPTLVVGDYCMVCVELRVNCQKVHSILKGFYFFYIYNFFLLGLITWNFGFKGWH